MNSSLYRLFGLMALWGVAASFAGYFELFIHLPTFAVPVLVAALTVAFSLALRRVGWLRDATATLGARGLMAPHVVRFVGGSFLWLQAQGRLPAEFAQAAGWGDIAVAVGAMVLIVWPEGRGFQRALIVWNVLGALDLLIAIGIGGWLNATRPSSMIEMAGFPLTLVPLWLVPVLLSSHLLMLQQFRTDHGASTARRHQTSGTPA
jgi:hypothetical protein